MKTTLRFACQVNISLKIINKVKFLGLLQGFPKWWVTCPHTKRIKLKLSVLFPDEILSLKSKSCIIQIPTIIVINNKIIKNKIIKIVSASTCQTKLKKILIKQKHLIWIIFHANEETHARPSFQELLLLICVK